MSATVQQIIPTKQPPVPGQLVAVRNRRFVVTAVTSSSMHEEQVTEQNLVTLSSVEDDSEGEAADRPPRTRRGKKPKLDVIQGGLFCLAH